MVHSQVAVNLLEMINDIHPRYFRSFFFFAWSEVLEVTGCDWLPLLVGYFKCNLDVAVISSHSVLAVMCDFEGSLCMAYTECIIS